MAMIRRSVRIRWVPAVACAVAVAMAAVAAPRAATPANRTLIIDAVIGLKSLDPGREGHPINLLVTRATYTSLLQYRGTDFTPRPALAKSYDVSADGRTYTFHLRNDIKFSDGSPVTADDVVFSYNRTTNIKGSPSFFFEGIAVSAPDDQTVVLTAQKPNPAIPSIVAFPGLAIVNAKVVRANGGTDAADASQNDRAEQFLSTQSEGSGPYLLKEYTPADHITLVTNPRYVGPRPFYDTVVIRNMAPETQALTIQRSAGDEIAIDISADLATVLKNSPRLHVTFNPTLTFFFVAMQMSPKVSPVTANVHIRNAIRYGIDYNGVVGLTGPGSIQASGVVVVPIPGALPGSEAVRRDVAKAKAEVAESGISDPTVPFTYATEPVAGVSFGRLAEKIKADLADVGITVNLNPGPNVTVLTAYRAGTEPGLGLWAWNNDYPDPADYLVFGPGQQLATRMNWLADADPQLAQLYAQAVSSTDRTARNRLFQQIQRRLNQVGPFVPLVQPTQVLVTTSNLTQADFSPTWQVDVGVVGSK